MERLQKKIANNSKYSRRKAEELILDGQVKVNGVTIAELGTKVSDNDEITINNKTLFVEEKVYYLLNKPKGVISSCDDEKDRKTVVDLLKKDISDNIYPVGRLDFNTTGVLLLTNDGELTNFLTHPKNNINKTYVAKVLGDFSKEDILSLEKGVVIDGFKTSRAKIQILKLNSKAQTARVQITIHEGRNHQVKKMFETIGGKVVELKRTEYAFLTTTGLKAGEYRRLTVKEIKRLYGLNNEK